MAAVGVKGLTLHWEPFLHVTSLLYRLFSLYFWS